MIKKVTTFVSEAKLELKKVSWTPVDEILSSTWVVIASVIMLTLYVSIIDALLKAFIYSLLFKLVG
jgi:preprotein translocase subunit SecE